MPPLAASAATPPDYLALRYRPDVHLLVGRWQRPVSPTELRQGYRALLHAAQQAGCPYWQLDLRGRNAPDEAARQWLVQQFIPEAASQLASPICLGYLLPPSLLAKFSLLPAGPAQVAFFSEEGALTSWLTQCQHRGRLALFEAGFRPPPVA